MKVIGITGGVGSGKSQVLEIIESIVNCVVIRSDELAKSLERKGEVCYGPLIELLGNEIVGEDGEIVPALMAKAIFSIDSDDLLKGVNAIIHPEVKKRILSLIEAERRKSNVDYFFIEAALLIEDHYDLICDELWYIYCDESIRRERLKESRGYSDEKIDGIMESQLDDTTFRQYCRNVVDNSGLLEDTKNQLIKIFQEERV